MIIESPNITEHMRDREKVAQMQKYLYRLASQLNIALSNVETAEGKALEQAHEQAVNGSTGSLPTPAETFGSIKNLIIKSADIVQAYTEEMEKTFNGLYVGQSDFGSYKSETSQKITANDTGIKQLFTNFQNLSKTVDRLYDQELATTAYLKTGLLEYDENGFPIYGLEIGQKNSQAGQEVFDKFARFAADRLSFYDSNDVEVAYVSDYKLFITNAEVTGSLVLGGKFKLSCENGLAFQWVGRS